MMGETFSLAYLRFRELRSKDLSMNGIELAAALKSGMRAYGTLITSASQKDIQAARLALDDHVEKTDHVENPI